MVAGRAYGSAMRLVCTIIIAAWVVLAGPGPARAHPHIFIEAGMIFLFDAQGRLEAVEITRTYDELYSLLLVEDMGFDPDGDGTLTDEERAKLAGFDLDLDAGFTGDFFVSRGDKALALGAAHSPTVRMADGVLTTTHIRPLAEPVGDLAGLTFKAYDPTFYAAYETTGLLAARGRNECAVLRQPADLDAAYTLVEELLYGPKSDQYNENNYPEVGEAFADTIRVECRASS